MADTFSIIRNPILIGMFNSKPNLIKKNRRKLYNKNSLYSLSLPSPRKNKSKLDSSLRCLLIFYFKIKTKLKKNKIRKDSYLNKK